MKDKAYFVWYCIGTIVLIVFVLWVLSQFKSLIALLIICTLVSYLIFPIVNFFTSPIDITIPNRLCIFQKEFKLPWNVLNLKTKKGLHRVVAISMTFLLLAICIALLMFYIVPFLGTEMKNLYNQRIIYKDHILAMYKNSIIFMETRTPNTLKPFLPHLPEQPDMNQISLLLKQIAIGTMPIVKNAMNSMAYLFLIPFITFYILMDYDRYQKSVLSLIPASKREGIRELFFEIHLMLRKYIKGQLLVCLIIGTSVTIALLILGIPYAILIGMFAGLIDVVPYIGVILSMLPAIVFALFKSPVYAIVVLIVLYAIHWFEGHVIIPNIMGQSIDLPPLTIVIALIIGAELMGLLGIFLAVPVAATIRVIIEHYVRRRDRLEASGEGN